MREPFEMPEGCKELEVDTNILYDLPVCEIPSFTDPKFIVPIFDINPPAISTPDNCIELKVISNNEVNWSSSITTPSVETTWKTDQDPCDEVYLLDSKFNLPCLPAHGPKNDNPLEFGFLSGPKVIRFIQLWFDQELNEEAINNNPRLIDLLRSINKTVVKNGKEVWDGSPFNLYDPKEKEVYDELKQTVDQCKLVLKGLSESGCGVVEGDGEELNIAFKDSYDGQVIGNLTLNTKVSNDCQVSLVGTDVNLDIPCKVNTDSEQKYVTFTAQYNNSQQSDQLVLGLTSNNEDCKISLSTNDGVNLSLPCPPIDSSNNSTNVKFTANYNSTANEYLNISLNSSGEDCKLSLSGGNDVTVSLPCPPVDSGNKYIDFGASYSSINPGGRLSLKLEQYANDCKMSIGGDSNITLNIPCPLVDPNNKYINFVEEGNESYILGTLNLRLNVDNNCTLSIGGSNIVTLRSPDHGRAAFECYKNSYGTMNIVPGPVFWWFFYPNQSYNNVVGWSAINYLGDTNVSLPSQSQYKLCYVKVTRNAAGGASDSFNVSLQYITDYSLTACLSAMCGVSAWNVFVAPIACWDNTGYITQMQHGAVYFRDTEAPGTIKLWFGSASSIPDGWEVIQYFDDYFLKVNSQYGGATEEPLNPIEVTHDHDVTLTKETIYTGLYRTSTSAVEVVTDVDVQPTDVDITIPEPKSVTVVLIRKL